MERLGEIIALFVAISWTATAVFAEIATKRLGTLTTNVVRMGLSVILLSLVLLFTTGSMLPQGMNIKTIAWFGISGLVGYVFGDYCLYKCYTYIGSRFGQLLMTLSSLFATIAGYLFLSETIPAKSLIGIFITLFGISLSILHKGRDGKKLEINLSPIGILLGLGAAMGQGVGLVLSKTGLLYYGISSVGESQIIHTMMPFSGTLTRSFFGFIGFVALLLATGGLKNFKQGIKDKTGMFYSFLVSVFGPVIGVSLSLLAVELTSVGIAQTIMSISPVLILIPSYFIFKQKITPHEILGAVISVAGVMILMM